jgi:hypothetical protein
MLYQGSIHYPVGKLVLFLVKCEIAFLRHVNCETAFFVVKRDPYPPLLSVRY